MRLELSTRPDERIGTDEMWDKAEEKLKNALDAQGLQYELNPGDGAFYGPKIDMHMTDSLGRSWQLGTVQLDYSMPERFDLTYTGADNQEHRPVMIHRAAFGSYERFIGIMLEHYGGELPLWLAPVQAIVLPISDPFNEYGAAVRDSLRRAGLRVELDARGESIGKKIREAELRKIPRMLIVGEREMQAGEVVGARARQGRGTRPAGPGRQRVDRGLEGQAAGRDGASGIRGPMNGVRGSGVVGNTTREARSELLFETRRFRHGLILSLTELADHPRGAILGPVEARQSKAPRVIQLDAR